MTAGVDAYLLGKSDGSTPEKVFSPMYYWSSADKEQYRKGFHDARVARGLEVRRDI